MIEKAVLYLIAALLTLGGIYIFKKPNVIASFLKYFYSNYPLVRYAGEKQLTSKRIFIRFAGITIILMGLLSIIALYLE